MPQEIVTTRYRTFDGEVFDTYAVARLHERENAFRRVGLTVEQWEKVRGGEAPEIAEALEILGDVCKADRLKRGEYRRKPSTADDPAPADEAEAA